MSPPPLAPVLRAMVRGDAEQVARLHAGGLGLPEEVVPLAWRAYEALAESPLAVLQVAALEGRVVGFVLATSDAQRLVSDLLSRLPGTLMASLVRAPGRTRDTLRLFRGGLRRSGATAEILALTLEPGWRGRGLARDLVGEALEELRRRGVEEVWAAVPAQAAQALKPLHRCGFQRDPQAPAAGDRTVLVRRGLVPDPGWCPGPFKPSDRLRCALRLEMLVILPIYGLALIPFASLLAWLGCQLDRQVGLPPVLPEPWNLLALAVLLALGGLLLLWSYSYLILEGEGGPVPPFSAKTRRLVRTGPYAVVRHPSVVAKLLGVVGLGCGFNSWSFLFGIIPMLLAWSVLWNGSRQDGDLVRVFGDEYLEYRRCTPMLVPRLRRRKR